MILDLVGPRWQGRRGDAVASDGRGRERERGQCPLELFHPVGIRFDQGGEVIASGGGQADRDL